MILTNVSEFTQLQHPKMGKFSIPMQIGLKNNKKEVLEYRCITNLTNTATIPVGGYGLVLFYENENNQDDRLAMKLFNTDYIINIKGSNLDSFLREEYFFKLLNEKLDSEFKHCKKNVIEYITSDHYKYDSVQYYFLLLRKMDMDLDNYIRDHSLIKNITLIKAKQIIYQIAKSLDCLHELGYIYNDLKPANILINKDGECRLTDFNCITEINNVNSKFKSCSTRSFRSPEQFNDTNDILIDSWQLGLLILCILMKTSQSIIHILVNSMSLNYKQIIQNIDRTQIEYFLNQCRIHYKELKEEIEFNALSDLILGLLDKTIKKRLDIKQVLSHTFFHDLNRPKSRCKRGTRKNKKTGLCEEIRKEKPKSVRRNKKHESNL